MSNTEQKQRVKEIMNEAEEKLSAEIGKPVNLMYRIKVNHLNSQLIIHQVLRVCKITYSEMVSKSNEQKYVVARRLVMWLVSYYCGNTQADIAELVHIDRSAVSHGIAAVNNSLDVQDPLYLVPLKEIETSLLQITSVA